MLRNPFTATHEETGAALSDFVEGELQGWRRWRVARHLARCEYCRAVYQSLLRTLEALRDAAAVEPTPQPAVADAVLERIRREASQP